MSAPEKDCFLTGKHCGVQANLQNPSCFVSIPFHLQDELQMIKATLESLGLGSIVADKKPPQFLFYDVCEKLSESLFGVFEITETNENVLIEYGMTVEQGKPAILMYDKIRRKTEPSSNMKGILQTRYSGLNEIGPKLSETILTMPAKMSPPKGSVLQVVLCIYELSKTLQDELRTKGYRVVSNRSVKFLKEDDDYLTYKADMTLQLSQGDEEHTVRISPEPYAWKHKVGVGLYELPVITFIKSRVPPGQSLLERMEKLQYEIGEILKDALKKISLS